MTFVESAQKYRLISSDSHVLEPVDLWTSRVPAAFKDRVPRIEWLPEGGAWVIEGVDEPIAFGFTMSAGRDPADLRDWIQPEELPVAHWGDPAWRVATMQADGIDAEILFPNRPFQGVVGCTDRELHNVEMRAYNDWLSDFCSYAPDRLGGIAGIPNRGVEDAVAEIERCADKPGLVGYLMTCYPHGGNTIVPEDDAVWAAVSATGKPLSIHIFLDGSMPFNILAEKLPGASHFSDCPHRLRDFIVSGVLERFPDLKIVFHEVDCGWLPYYGNKMDQVYARSGLTLPRLPSEYIRERFWYSFIHDPVAIANRDWLGSDRMLWSNDYPHIATDWPRSWQALISQYRAVPTPERDQILWRNSLDLFAFAA